VGRVYRPGVMRVGDLLVAERASCESKRSRGALLYGPCMRRARSRHSRRGCLVRVGVGTWSRRPVELASCETDPVRGRGALSLLWFNRFVLFYRWLWVPLSCRYRQQHMYVMGASDNIMYLDHASTCARFVMLENM
jgi:hypothetical protein